VNRRRDEVGRDDDPSGSLGRSGSSGRSWTSGSFGRFASGKARRGRQLARGWWMIALAALGILAATIVIAFLV
jgi:hypothetical protein